MRRTESDNIPERDDYPPGLDVVLPECAECGSETEPEEIDKDGHCPDCQTWEICGRADGTLTCTTCIAGHKHKPWQCEGLTCKRLICEGVE